jgi:di/tricarboxylate transporter
MPIELNQQILSYLVILVSGLVLFSVASMPLEFSAIFILVALVFAGLLTPAQAFIGFGSETIILFGSLFVLVQALVKTGVVRSLEQSLLKYAGNNRSINYFLLLIVGSIQSALISNTATMAVMIPLSNSIAARFSETPRRWLMPLAFIVMVSGMFTLIGTSTNILVSGMLPSFGLSPLSLFSTSAIALCLWLFCILYALFVMPHILGPGESVGSAEIDIKYDLRSFSAEVVVLSDSPLCNLSLVNNPVFSKLDITVLGIMRPGQFLVYPSAQYIVRAEDRLILEGNVKSLSEASNSYGLRFLEEHKVTEKGQKDQQDIRTPTLKLYEVLVTARSLLNGRTAIEVALRSRYRISLVAINRHGTTMRERLSKIKIESGDLLLVQFLDFIDNQVISDLGLIPLQRIDPNVQVTAMRL